MTSLLRRGHTLGVVGDAPRQSGHRWTGFVDRVACGFVVAMGSQALCSHAISGRRRRAGSVGAACRDATTGHRAGTLRQEEGAIDTIRTLAAWDASAHEEREQVVTTILQRLTPSASIRFLGWERHVLGDQAHTTALFAHGPRRLALLPGYVGELGYDPARHALPAHLADAWWEHRNPRDATFADFLGRTQTPLRQVTLAPFLIETTAAPLAQMSWAANGRGVQLERPPKHAELLAELMGQGCRYPTVDEWEYACSGGSRAFFRWGDAWPPIARSPLRMRGLDDWREDTLPNAFGLLIGQDPQELEFTMEPGELKGGDSGAASQLDNPDLEWLGFATSRRCLPAHVDLWHDPYLRRVIPLDGVA